MINVLSLFLLNMIFFLCNFYPKHIIEINSPFSFVAIILNLLFYLLFSFYLVILFNKNKNFFSEKIFSPFEKFTQKIQLKKIVIICSIQILFDLLMSCLKLIFNKNILYFSDIIIILIWVINYIICVKKENNIFLRKRFYIVIISFLVLFIISVSCDFIIIKEYNSVLNKYNMDSSIVIESVNNLDFIYQIKSFILDTVSGLTLIIFHTVFNNFAFKKEKVIRKIICGVLLIFISFLFTFLKLMLYAPNSIKGINVTDSITKEYVSHNSFSANTKTIKIKRIDGNYIENDVFQKTYNQLFYNGNIVLEYTSYDDVKSISYFKENNEIIMRNCFEKISDEIEFYLYKNETICFLNDNTPIIVLPNQSYDKYDNNLIVIYKKLIKDNNWEFFEQGAEYLLKYNESFITPYLERFACSEFSNNELEKLEHFDIQKSYIQYISKQMLKT